ncbi:hypothetical protein QBC40DRAFT_68080 [Triangularia verruculosa]|uniref:Putative gamma-glutamylcyclotransferase n=1 Tax=Triangularia verruculosa TaxID=2587418 RepID=A0AAN6XI17_9PEZI|nr:hypothetical protein QBC40DRAFT_68080 [Triangularia verruculosa]
MEHGEDLLLALESWSQVAIQQSAATDEPDQQTIQRWQHLFSYTASEAARHIEEQRKDDSRLTLTGDGWKMIATEKEAEGYDKEAYEHALWLARSAHATTITTNPDQGKKGTTRPQTFLLKLGPPLATPEHVKTAAGLEITPPIFTGTGDDGEPTSFCKIVGAEYKDAILSYLSRTGHTAFRPTFIRHSVAEKNLCSISAHPTLGLDSTLPQHRPNSCNANDPACLPTQNQYPVVYFVYGTLMNPAILKGKLTLDTEPVYKRARIRGGLLKTWGNKYNAVVDAPQMDHNKAIVDGCAFTVENSMQEDALCHYETDKYEVVRCTIELPEECKVVKGLTFRFVGETD